MASMWATGMAGDAHACALRPALPCGLVVVQRFSTRTFPSGIARRGTSRARDIQHARCTAVNRLTRFFDGSVTSGQDGLEELGRGRGDGRAASVVVAGEEVTAEGVDA